MRRLTLFAILMLISGILYSLHSSPTSAQLDTERPIIDATTVRRLTPLASLGTGPVFDVQWSPYNNRLAVANNAGVWLYDSLSLQPRGRLRIGADMGEWSPYGSRLATTNDNIIRIWDPFTGEQRAVLDGHSNSINSIKWSPDGTKIASASGYFSLAEGIPGELQIWDAETHEGLQLIGGNASHPEFGAKSVAWSPDSRFVAAITTGATVTAWDAESGEVALIFDIDSEFRGKLAWSPNGEYIVVSGGDGSIHVYDGFTGESLHILPEQDQPTWELKFNHTGTILASGHREGVVIFWDVATWTMIRRVQHNLDDVLSLSFSGDDTKLAAAGSDDLVRIIDVDSGEQVAVLQAHIGAAWKGTFSPDGQQIITSGLNHRLDSWDTTTWSYETINHQAEFISQIIPSPNGDWVAVVGRGLFAEGRTIENGLVLIRPDGGVNRLLIEVESALAIGRGVVFSPNGDYIAAVVDDAVWVWSTETGQVLHTFTTTESLINNGLMWSPDGSQVALMSRSFRTSPATLWVWDMETSEQIVELVHDHSVNAVAWSDNGIQLATVYVSGDVLAQTDEAVESIQLWDVANGSQSLLLRGHTDQVRLLKWSPDGRLLASGSYDETVRVWSAETGAPLYRLSVLDRVRDIQWSPDGSVLLVQTEDSTLWFYDGPTGAFLSQMNVADSGEFVWSPDSRLILENMGGTVHVWGIPSGQDCVITAERLVNRRWWSEVGSVSMGSIDVGEAWVATGQAVDYQNVVWWRLGDHTWVRSDVVNASGDCNNLPSIVNN